MAVRSDEFQYWATTVHNGGRVTLTTFGESLALEAEMGDRSTSIYLTPIQARMLARQLLNYSEYSGAAVTQEDGGDRG